MGMPAATPARELALPEESNRLARIDRIRGQHPLVGGCGSGVIRGLRSGGDSNAAWLAPVAPVACALWHACCWRPALRV